MTADPSPLVHRLAVIGLGLIGGSVALAARQSGAASQVIGVAAGTDGQRALELGLVDSLAPSIPAAVAQADLVVVATPVDVAGPVFAALATTLRPDALVTDCGSTKGSVIARAREHLGAAFDRYVPGHPIAGSERSGPDAAQAGLFLSRRWLFCPVSAAQQAHVGRLGAFVARLGATAQVVDAIEHDAVFAEYSHAPHALVFAMCLAVCDGPWGTRLTGLAGAGLRDTTRIGASSPTLWADIMLDNAPHTLASIDRFDDALAGLRSALANGQRDALISMLERASSWRAALDGQRD